MHVNKPPSDKVIYEEFSRIAKKNDFSFEALEVLSHILFLLKKCLKTHGFTAAAWKIYTSKVWLSFKYKCTKCKLRQ